MTEASVDNLRMTREINIMCHRDFEHMEILEDILKLYSEMNVQRLSQRKT
jgi:hypothetical protein